MKVAPGQITFIEEINHDVHQRLNIISPALIISPATIETGKQKVAAKLLSVYLLDMSLILVKVPASQSKIDQINQRWVFVPYQNVVKLKVIMDIAHFVQNTNTFDLRNKNRRIELTNCIVIMYTDIFENYFPGHYLMSFLRFGPRASIRISAYLFVSILVTTSGNPWPSSSACALPN